MKVAIYARVSKSTEGIQDTDNQILPLRDLAKALNADVVQEYIDKVSGATSNRPQFQQMMKNAANRKFEMILIWSLDRFSREGILQTLRYIEDLRHYGVALKSLQESWLDTRDRGFASLLIAILSWVAQQERQRISERTKAGLRKAENVGKRGPDKKPRNRLGYYKRYSKKRER